MKKLLLLGAATLMCAAVGKADIRYLQDGEPFSGSPSEVIAKMKEHQAKGGLYFLQTTKTQGPHSKSGSFIYSAHTDRKSQFRWDFPEATTISEFGEANNNKVYKVEVEDATQTITIKSMYSNHYFTIQGNNGYGKHHVWGTLDGTDLNDRNNPLTIAKYEVQENATELVLADDVLKENRYRLKVTNGTRDNDGTTPIYLQSYNNNDNLNLATYAVLSYQSYPTANTTAQVAFFPVKEVETITITVKFPDWNGIAMTEEVEAIEELSVEHFITEAANAHGGLTEMKITSDSENSEDLIPSSTNNVFTVTGNWNYDFEANQVYRISLNPGDNPSALRYMLDAKEIRCKIDGEETLSRLIPERLWFFKEGTNPNSFSLHNLYDPSKGVHFTPNAQGSYDNAKATYEEDVTYFNLVHSTVDNQFYLKIDGTENAYVNNYHNYGYFSIYHTNTPDANCILQIYPLEKRDFEALELPENTIPTVDNISEAVATYNGRNIKAALRRIGYWGGEELIGWQPGRFDNENKDFMEKLATAHALQAKIDEGEEIDNETIEQAVADIDFRNLKFNEIQPGMFYRFKNKASGKYISCDSWGQATINGKSYDLLKLIDEEQATHTNTIFYVDGTENGAYTLVSYETGLVLPDFDGSTTYWLPVLSSDTHAGHAYQITHQHLRGCILHSSVGNAHRHLHGGGNVASSPGAVNAAGDLRTDEYQWYVELVEELPVTFYNTFGQDGDNEGWASVYSPVALEVPAAYTHTTAYTGVFDNNDYTGKLDINHVHATPIEPNEEGRVIIPANQPALLFYDGEVDAESNPNLEPGSEDEERDHIVYLNLPVVFDHESTDEIQGNLKASFTAFANDADTDFYTLHASSNNNFRVYEKYKPSASYIPGFKAYLDEAPVVENGEEETYFPIYTINPNTMVPLQDNEGYETQVDPDDESMLIITLTTPGTDYEVYYKHTPKAAAPQRRAASVDHSGYTLADHVEGTNVHTITVSEGNLEYYAYHPASNFKGVVRTATVNTTTIEEINGVGVAPKVYDLQGRKLAAPAKGFNIVNGKKVIVK